MNHEGKAFKDIRDIVCIQGNNGNASEQKKNLVPIVY